MNKPTKEEVVQALIVLRSQGYGAHADVLFAALDQAEACADGLAKDLKAMTRLADALGFRAEKSEKELEVMKAEKDRVIGELGRMEAERKNNKRWEIFEENKSLKARLEATAKELETALGKTVDAKYDRAEKAEAELKSLKSGPDDEKVREALEYAEDWAKAGQLSPSPDPEWHEAETYFGVLAAWGQSLQAKLAEKDKELAAAIGNIGAASACVELANRERDEAQATIVFKNSHIDQLQDALAAESARVVGLMNALKKIASSAPCKADHESFNSPGQPCDQRIAENALRKSDGSKWQTIAQAKDKALALIKAEAYGEKSWAKVVDLIGQVESVASAEKPAEEKR